MGSINQLEKLHKLLALFQSTPDSLERVVACERINSTIKKTEELINQRSFLREERRQVRLLAEEVERKKRILIQLKQVNWSSASVSHPIDTGTLGTVTPKDKDKNRRIKFNLGGLLFESPVATLTKDSTSLLAQLCHKDSTPMEANKDGYYCFDRDWWLFRHILNFLRDGNLPEDRKLLAQLYKEASFWNLKSLQRAIEEQKLQLIAAPTIPTAAAAAAANNGSITSAVAAIGLSSKILDPTPITSVTALASKEWWRSQPSWWFEREKQLAADKSKVDKEIADKLAAEQASKPGDKDWWTGGSYNGRTFLPMPPSLAGATAAVPTVLEPVRRPVTPGGRIAPVPAAVTAAAPVIPVSAPPLILNSIFPATRDSIKSSGSGVSGQQGRAYAYGTLPRSSSSSSSSYLPPDYSADSIAAAAYGEDYSSSNSGSVSSQYAYMNAPTSAPSPASQVHSLKEYMKQHNLSTSTSRHANPYGDHSVGGSGGSGSGTAAVGVRMSSESASAGTRGKENAGSSGYNHALLNSGFGSGGKSYHTRQSSASSPTAASSSGGRGSSSGVGGGKYAAASTASARTGASAMNNNRAAATAADTYTDALGLGLSAQADDDYRILDREIEFELEAAKQNSRNKIAAASAAVSTLDREMAELLHSYIKVTNENDGNERSLID